MNKQVDTTYFVSPQGDDGYSGELAEPNADRSDGPFATLTRARDAVRERKAQAEDELQGPVTVMVRGGKYFLDQTLVLTENDGGTRDFPVTWCAYPHEESILSGGRKIGGWKPYKANILQCDLPDARFGQWKFRQLFFNGQRQTRSRYPNFDPDDPICGGWAFVEAPVEDAGCMGFKYESSSFERHWDKPRLMEVFLVKPDGVTDILPIRSIDEHSRTIMLVDEVIDHFGMPYVLGPTKIGPGYRFYVENALEALDQPGQWCLDCEEGKLYFWPPDSIESAEVVAPTLTCLIDVVGASHLNIRGFTFTETRSDGENMHRGGHEGYGAMLPKAGRRYCGEALHLRGAEHCCIENNHFCAVGANAIYVEGHNLRHIIRNNQISHAGGIGVCLIGRRYANPKMPRQYPIYNHVTDNHIHHCGHFDKYVAGVFLGLSQGNVIAHNRIENMPHHAINLGNSAFGRNIVEYNEIRYVCCETNDNGAINCWMEDPYGHVEGEAPRSGHVIRYNLIRDVQGLVRDEDDRLSPSDVTFGIYLDNYTSNCFVYGNIVVRCRAVGIYMQGGRNNIVENNIIVDSLCATHLGGWWQPQMEGFMTGNHFCRNIFYRTSDDQGVLHRHIAYTTEPLSDAIGQSDHNLLFSTRGKDFTIQESSSPLSDMDDSKRLFPVWPQIKDISFAQWQKQGFSAHSMFGDPLFVDPEHDDYRLRPGSPALRIGFQPIDVSRIGIRG